MLKINVTCESESVGTLHASYMHEDDGDELVGSGAVTLE